MHAHTQLCTNTSVEENQPNVNTMLGVLDTSVYITDYGNCLHYDTSIINHKV